MSKVIRNGVRGKSSSCLSRVNLKCEKWLQIFALFMGFIFLNPIQIALAETENSEVASVKSLQDVVTLKVQAPISQGWEITQVRVDGLQRVSVSVVYQALLVNVGDRANDALLSQSTRAIYATGKFSDVQLLREENTLVIKVNERPTIMKIDIEGNKILDTESLETGLKESGLQVGSVLQRATLDQIRQELERQYVSQGRYGARIETKVEPKTRNRVHLTIQIDEGKLAEIKYINVIGNKVFDDETLLKQFQLRSSHLTSFFKKDDQYAREKLVGDLEILRSYYLDRGYVNFKIESTQVAISGNREEVFITVAVKEGVEYKVGNVKILGQLPIAMKDLESLVLIKSDQVFSRQLVTLSSDLMIKRLGDDGFTFAEVRGIPSINQDDKKVNVDFYVEPRKRVYVRRIHFSGNTKTQDEVLRREMRQMEGAWADGQKIELSRARLERLGFFRSVQVETKRIPGTEDQIDLSFEVEEQPSGSIGASIGYQDGTGLIFGANVSQTNFLGTGNRVAFALSRTDIRNAYNFSFVDPYYTVDGVSRGFSVFYQETDYDEDDNTTSYRTDSLGGDLNFGYPISENARLNFGIGFDTTTVYAFDASAQEVKDFIGYVPGDGATQSDSFDTVHLNGSWLLNRLNRGLLPDRGDSHQFSVELALPGSDQTYYKAKYAWQQYWGLTARTSLRAHADLGYGEGFGDIETLPFYKNFFAGGFGSVRGFDERSLGPKDSNGNDAFGGNLLVETGVEWIVPTPFAQDQRAFRTTVFLDAGNVFNSEVTEEVPLEFNELRTAVGVSFTWIAPIGPIAFSFASPINEQEGDETKSFQFSLGQTF
ncbi:MAG: outer membrane protein assembly factor BamA [Pseudomonadota bacterium]